MNIKELLQNIGLSKEEEEVLNSLQNKFDDYYQKQINDLQEKTIKEMQEDTSVFEPDAVHPLHATKYPRELRFHIIGEISSLDIESNRTTDIRLVQDSYYHIPVPENIDCKIKLEEFNTYLDDAIKYFARSVHKKIDE